MATFSDRGFIERLIRRRGGGSHEADDPPAVKIVEYDNAWGGVAWGVVFQGEADPDRYQRSSAHVRNPRVIWTRGEEGD